MVILKYNFPIINISFDKIIFNKWSALHKTVKAKDIFKRKRTAFNNSISIKCRKFLPSLVILKRELSQLIDQNI